ncbi:MAG: hypothetical protein IJV93_13625 [Lentisphaeria bacterium]|nr:hypothetical protein [Lentisphaeria bacterium]
MKYLLSLFFPAALFFSGCTPNVPSPPTEQNDLVVRFFRSLRNNAGAEAALQGQKLYTMDKRNYFLLKLISVQQANSYISNAQRAINAGKLEDAIKELQNGIRRFPANAELHNQLDKLRKLRHAERLFIAMRSAPNPAAMNSALAAAQAGFQGIESAKLNKFFTDYRKNIERWNNHTPKAGASSESVPIRSFDDK